jgi:hypothetical protein
MTVGQSWLRSNIASIRNKRPRAQKLSSAWANYVDVMGRCFGSISPTQQIRLDTSRVFIVESWLEHLRQHERVTVADRALEDELRSFYVAGNAPVVTHPISARMNR